jgi:tetratricopeptide (TPR) repeat protein
MTAALEDLAKANADNPVFLGRLAAALQVHNRLTEAMNLYVSAVKQGKGANSELVIQGCSLALRLGQVAKALEIADAGRTGQPKEGNLRMGLANLFLEAQGRLAGKEREDVLAKAETLFSESVELIKDKSMKAQARYGLARTQTLTGKTDAAAATYARAAETWLAGGGERGKWAEWSFEGALLLVKLKKTEEARTLLAQIVKESPEGAARTRATQELAKLPEVPKPTPPPAVEPPKPPTAPGDAPKPPTAPADAPKPPAPPATPPAPAAPPA